MKTCPLTVRETEVMRLVCAGATNKEIGDALCIAPKTAKNHVSNILRLVDARNRTHMAHLARENGWL